MPPQVWSSTTAGNGPLPSGRDSVPLTLPAGLSTNTGRLSNFTFVLLNPVSNRNAATATGNLMRKVEKRKVEE
jgi:hypothetical protein